MPICLPRLTPLAALLLLAALGGCTEASGPEAPPAETAAEAPAEAPAETPAEVPAGEEVAEAPAEEAAAPAEAEAPAAPVVAGPPRSLAGEWRATPPGPGDRGCFAEQIRPAVVETVTEQVQIAPEMRDPASGAVTAPAAYRTSTHARIVEGREKMWFATLCADELTPGLIVTLQRALAARGLYAGPETGRMDEPTRAAVRAYQRPRGLFSATLSRRAAQEMGLIPWLDAGKPQER